VAAPRDRPARAVATEELADSACDAVEDGLVHVGPERQGELLADDPVGDRQVAAAGVPVVGELVGAEEVDAGRDLAVLEELDQLLADLARHADVVDERPDVLVVGVRGDHLGYAGEALVVAAAVLLAVADELVQQGELRQADQTPGWSRGGTGSPGGARRTPRPAGSGSAPRSPWTPSMRSWCSVGSSSGLGVTIASPSRVVMVLTGPKLKQTRSPVAPKSI
jgi:hypothetical protein